MVQSHNSFSRWSDYGLVSRTATALTVNYRMHDVYAIYSLLIIIIIIVSKVFAVNIIKIPAVEYWDSW